MRVNPNNNNYTLIVFLFVLLSVPQLGFSQVINLSNDCNDAELFIIEEGITARRSFFLGFVGDYTSSGIDEYVPIMDEFPDMVFTGEEGWVRINTGPHNYIIANSSIGSNSLGKNFNIFDNCNGNKLNLTSINNTEGLTTEVYQVTPETEYLIQVLIVQSSNSNFTFTEEQQRNVLKLAAFDRGGHSNCESALDITNLDAIPPFYIAASVGRYYVKYTAAETGALQISNARTSDKHTDCFETTDYPNLSNTYHRLEAGNTYYFLVLMFRDIGTLIPVTVTFSPEPNNTTCEESIVLNVGDATTQINYQLYPETTVPEVSSFTSTKAYYSFSMPASGGVRIISNRHNRIFEDCNSEEILNFYYSEFGRERTSSSFYGVPNQEYVIESIQFLKENSSIRLEEIPATPHLNQYCSSALPIVPAGQVQEIEWSQTRGRVWYKIENPSAGTLIIQKNYNSNYRNLHYNIYAGNCGQFTEISTNRLNDSASEYLADLPPGEFYYLEMSLPFGELSLERPFTLNFTASNASQPPNDICNGALLYQDFGTSLPSLAGSTLPENGVPTCDVINSQYTPNVWYTFECPETGTIQIPWNATVYEGDCNNLSMVHCSKGQATENTSNGTGSSRRVRLTPGEIYFVSAFSNSLRINEISYTDSECENPTPIEFLTNTKLSIFNEVASMYNAYAPSTCYSNLIPDKDVWYSFFTPEDVNNIEFFSLQNLGVSLYTGGCSSMTETACGEINDETNYLAELMPSTSYLLRVSGHRTETLQAQMNTIPIDQDICASAPSITVSSETFVIERYLPFGSDAIFDCANENIADRWMKFTSPPSGVVVVENIFSSVSEENYFVELYSDCASYVDGSCSSETVIIYDALPPSTEYILHISSASGEEASSVIYTPPLASANNSCSTAAALPAYFCTNEITGYSYGMSDGAWHTGTMPSEGALKLSFSSLSSGAVYVNECNNLVLHDSFEKGEDTIIEGIPAGASFYIQVEEQQRYSFCLEAVEGNQNPNFYCHDAFALITNTSLDCTNFNEIQLHRPNGDGNQRAYWYSFVATSVSMKVSGYVSSQLNASIFKTQVFDVCHGTLLAQSPELSDVNVTDLVIGNEYLVKVTATVDVAQITATCSTSSIENCFDIQTEQTFVSINICISELLDPAINDQCNTATEIPFSSAEVTLIDGTHRATDASYDCLPNARELWYSFTSVDDMNIIVKATEAQIPLNISTYKTSCATSRQACGVDSLIFTIDEGETYFIAVSITSANDNTNYTLSIAELTYENSENNIGIDIEEPVVKLQVDGGVVVGNSAIPFPGNIRYNGAQIQGFTSNGWKSLSNINPDDIDLAGDNMGTHSATMNLSMNNNQIDNVPLPLLPEQASNKEYVDLKIQQLSDELLNDTLDTVEPFLTNVSLSQEPLAKYLLNIETTENNHAVSMDLLYSGWSFQRPSGGFPYIYNNERNIAIGDQDPKEQLHIYDNVPMRLGSATDYFNFEYSGNDLMFSAVSDNLVDQHFILDYSVPGTQATSFDFDLRNRRLGINKEDPLASVHIATGPLDAMIIERLGSIKTVIDRDGKIGIGVTDPTTELDVDGQVQISTNSNGSVFQLNLIENNSGFSRLNFTNTSDKDITLAAIPSATTADSKLNFFIEDAGDVMTITGAERVGINNTSPQSDLHIKHANGATNGGLRLQNTSDANDDYWNFYVSSSNDELRLYANDIKVGDFDFTSGAYSSVSDERMKSGIQPLHFEWSKFMLLNAANYSFLHDTNKRQYLGLLAQEVQEIYPELVQYDEAEDTYRLDYSGTGVIAIKAVQELKNENDVLKKKLENLENKLEELIKLMK